MLVFLYIILLFIFFLINEEIPDNLLNSKNIEIIFVVDFFYLYYLKFLSAWIQAKHKYEIKQNTQFSIEALIFYSQKPLLFFNDFFSLNKLKK